ncbi:hypothetical protein [Halobacillus seohaensis]
MNSDAFPSIIGLSDLTVRIYAETDAPTTGTATVYVMGVLN